MQLILPLLWSAQRLEFRESISPTVFSEKKPGLDLGSSQKRTLKFVFRESKTRFVFYLVEILSASAQAASDFDLEFHTPTGFFQYVHDFQS